MDAESHVVAAIKAVGLDDTVWVPKIQESLKLDNIGLLKSVDRVGFESFLQQVEVSQRSALLEVYSQVSSFDPPDDSGEQGFVFVSSSSSKVCDLKAEDSSISLVDEMVNGENDEGKTLTVKEIFEEENRNFMETDQAQKPTTHHTVSTVHDKDGRNGDSPSQADTNQLENDQKDKKKDQHLRQFSAEMNEEDFEDVAQQRKDQVAEQTPKVPEVVQKDSKDKYEDKDNKEQDAEEQIDQTSKQTPTGSEEAQDVNESNPEKNLQQQNQISGQNAAVNEDVQEVNKVQIENGMDGFFYYFISEFCVLLTL